MNRFRFLALSVAFLPLFAVVSVAQNQIQTWGDVSGRVVWDGAVIPAVANFNLGNNPDKAEFEKNGPVKDETWIVNPKNKGLKNTFVWLEMTEKGAKLPIHPDLLKIAPQSVDVVHLAGAFVPHAVALRQGQSLTVKNRSRVALNFILAGDPTLPVIDFLLPSMQQNMINGLIASRFPFVMESKFHPWMQGWVRVFDHPYYAVTDDDGNFSIPKAPTGEFRMKIWHSSGGWHRRVVGKNGQPITIKAGMNKLDDQLYAAPD